MLEVAIIGAGFSGIGMGIRLRQSGVQNFLIFERAQRPGGVWRDNRYPGSACDVESALYSFSFAAHPDWSRRFAQAAEIDKYLADCCQLFELDLHLRCQHELLAADWDSELACWQLKTSQGVFQARVLISATGAFSEPKQPSLPGLESFGGTVFHSSRWPSDFNLNGQRVGVIGTGASAIQFIPAIQPQVAQLNVFQRTPAWIVPRPDRLISQRGQQLYRHLPVLQRLRRWQIYVVRELIGIGFRRPGLMPLMQKYALHHLQRSVHDPDLRQRLTPDYAMGCKRVLLSNNFYPAMTQSNVNLITDAIKAVTPSGLLTRSGQAYACDVLIFGTGFNVNQNILASRITGLQGSTLDDCWQGSPRAHLGTMVAGFPNFFLLLGPNTGLGHSSVVLMIEAQIELVLLALALIQKNNKALQPRADVQTNFVSQIEQRSAHTVWSAGCRSWYLDQTGRNATLWPGSIGEFKRRLLPLRPHEYEFL